MVSIISRFCGTESLLNLLCLVRNVSIGLKQVQVSESVHEFDKLFFLFFLTMLTKR